MAFSGLTQPAKRWAWIEASAWWGLETAHNLVVDFLWDRGYSEVYVIAPNVVRSTRGRYGQSGARTDQSDAFLLADLLRTDRARLQPWHPDSLLTHQIRAKASLIGHLTQSLIRHANRLRAVLLRYYPAALQVFSDLTCRITLDFVRAYPSPDAAVQLTFGEFETFARQHRYPNPSQLRRCFARLGAPQPEADPDTVLVYQDEVGVLAGLLLDLVEAKKAALRELQALSREHPDYGIFHSLPGAGGFLAAALLGKFGDDRQRFPNPAGLQALAGTCPVTDASGKRKTIRFRRACDREFRHIVQQWALCSLAQSIWVNAYWERVRPHCHSDSHAYRCLANRWLAIAWRLWQDRRPYDEGFHMKQVARRSRPRT
jgi:transposase